MISPIAGKISEHISWGKKSYKVKISNIKKEFKTIDEAHEFAKKIAHKILLSEHMLSVTIWYERIDKRASFLRYENYTELEGVEEIVESEESAYEYVSEHPETFKKNVKYRMLDERNYSFTDIARLSTNSVKGWFIPKVILATLISLISIALIFYSLHVIYLSNMSGSISSQNKIIITILTAVFAIPSFVIPLAGLYTPIRVKNYLRKYDGDVNMLPWRKLSILRKRYSWILIATSFIWMPITGYYIYELYLINAFDYYKDDTEILSLIIFAGTFLLLIIITLLSTIRSFTVRSGWWKENADKYFTKEEKPKFWNWMKDPSQELVYKSLDSSYFLINSDKNKDIVLSRQKIHDEIGRTMTIEDSRITREKASRHLANALKKIKQDKDFKNNL